MEQFSIKTTVITIGVILVILASCLYDSTCVSWIDSTVDTHWRSDSSSIEFYEVGGGVLTEDTIYEFGSFRKNTDSFYLYKLNQWDRWLAVNYDSIPIHELERKLLGTEFNLECNEATMTRDGVLVKYNITN